jgi:hypothetical protein
MDSHPHGTKGQPIEKSHTRHAKAENDLIEVKPTPVPDWSDQAV